VVLDLDGAARHSVYTLYNPYRVVIDFERPAPVARVAKDEPGAAWTPEPVAIPATATATLPAREDPVPNPPTTNRDGSFSLSRQLGLGISRVVIDAGHGGHDPGARVRGLNEADLTLDVALRLERLLLNVPGVEVTMTRRTNVYIPLDERTAIANRVRADLFLSIHANASNNPRARGIETYFLNFAPNPEAEALAARENAGSAKTMHNLPDIVRAIALNNKIDESRDFAALVQSSMFDRLRKTNRQARNLGVKQAPFMVLIGATMPSILAEISFLTNRQEGALLKTDGYRQAIAEALSAGVLRYQRSLKASQAVADQ
jgi:N-acetylmuramoyl-L-alanine amidase